MRFNTLLPLAFIIPFTLATPLLAEAPQAQISVTGEGRVAVAPDMAMITLGVTTQGATAAEALSANSTQMAAVLAMLTASGVEDRDVQTSGLNLNPVYDQSSYESGTPKVNGYIASNNVTVRVRALDSLGGLLDQLTTEGANTFNGVTFGIQEPEPLLDDARIKAVAEARRRAEIYAMAAGVKLGAIISITEQTAYSGPMPMEMSFAGAAKSDVPIAGGEVSLMAQVTVVYAVAE